MSAAWAGCCRARARSDPPNRPLARVLTLRHALIAGGIVALNIVLVGALYGSGQRALEAEVVSDMTEKLGAASEGNSLPADAPAREIFAAHPDAYAFALVDRTGMVLDAMNRALIPPSAVDLYADDWVTAVDLPSGRLLYAGDEFPDRADDLGVVFVMRPDPAGLLRRAFLSAFGDHV